MAIDVDPTDLVACGLDDFAAAWATRLRIPFSAFERRDGEHDGLYRARVVVMIEGLSGRKLGNAP